MGNANRFHCGKQVASYVGLVPLEESSGNLLKTEAIEKPAPMDARLASVLLEWRGRCPHNQHADYIFGSSESRGGNSIGQAVCFRKASALLLCALASASISGGVRSDAHWQPCSKQTVKRSRRLRKYGAMRAAV